MKKGKQDYRILKEFLIWIVQFIFEFMLKQVSLSYVPFGLIFIGIVVVLYGGFLFGLYLICKS